LQEAKGAGRARIHARYLFAIVVLVFGAISTLIFLPDIPLLFLYPVANATAIGILRPRPRLKRVKASSSIVRCSVHIPGKGPLEKSSSRGQMVEPLFYDSLHGASITLGLD
jgi:hypothetical protein